MVEGLGFGRMLGVLIGMQHPCMAMVLDNIEMNNGGIQWIPHL